MIVGLVVLVLGVLGIVSWWDDFGLVLRGLIPFLFVIGGLIVIGSGLTSGKSKDSDNDSQRTR